jgi:broad specificity phosphatase PhoE
VRRLLLVRHAPVELVDGVPADRWLLTDDGREAAAELARWPGWGGVSLIASSPEAKALGTAAPIAATAGVEVRVEPDLREAERPGQRVVPREDFLALTRSYLAGDDIPGWEPAGRVRRRVTACIARLAGEARGDVAVVSHGLALSLYLGASFEEWERIELPAVAIVDADTRSPLRPWTGLAGIVGT